MKKNLNYYFTLLCFSFLLCKNVNAQPQTGKFINASIGFGVSAPYEDVDISGYGFYAQGEYVIAISKWFGVRPYAGLILTSEDNSDLEINEAGYKVTSKAFLLGGKFRVAIPIPWVAPYLETGIGASIGSFETITPETNLEQKGVLLHIPVTLGLALGRKHNWDFAFTYYMHPSVEQFAGAAAIGFSFPLD
ncbi:hypothetical protein [Psychroserpens sp. MEBiC05023]